MTWDTIEAGWGETQPQAKPKSLKDDREKREASMKVKYEGLITKSVRSFQEVVALPLDKNTQTRIITTCNFNAITVLQALSEKYKITEMVMAIYRMNIAAVNVIVDWAKLKDLPIYLLLSAFFRENKKYERWTEIIEQEAKKSNKLNVRFAWSHAKVCLLKTECNKHIVFEGSGNLSDNARIEQYLIEDSKPVYDFHKKWIMDYFIKDDEA